MAHNAGDASKGDAWKRPVPKQNGTAEGRNKPKPPEKPQKPQKPGKR